MRRLLLPREHGAYAQLAFPLLSGLILGGPTLAGIGLSIAALSCFLAYEPLVVRLGIRGVRVQHADGAAARGQLRLLVPVGVLSGLGALFFAPAEPRLLALIPAGLGALLLPLVRARRVKSLVGETIVAAALASMHLPIAAAGGLEALPLWGPAVVWFTAFFVATLAVHAIKARQKQRDRWIGAAVVIVAAAVLIAAAALVAWVPYLRVLGLVLGLPVGAVLAVTAARVHPRSLKRVGWTLVAANTATLALLTLL